MGGSIRSEMLNTFPTSTVENVLYRSHADPVLPSDDLHRRGRSRRQHRKSLPNGEDIACRQAVFVVKLPLARSSLGIPVMGIVRICSKPQMRRIDAGRIVATGTVMKNKQTFRDFAPPQSPCETMGLYGNRLANFKNAVTVVVPTGGPNPTGLGDFNFGPEPEFQFGKQSLRFNRGKYSFKHRSLSGSGLFSSIPGRCFHSRESHQRKASLCRTITT